MYRSLGYARLRSGERARIVCVLGPDPDYRDLIGPFLGHKGSIWRWHIEEALDRPLEDLSTRFYLAEVDGRIAGNICTFERGPVGILGHVFTRPDQRQKGVARTVMEALLEDFRAREGRLLSLGTTYGSVAYRLYQSFGFHPILPESGIMQYSAYPEAEAEYWRPNSLQAARATWGDWAGVSLLMQQPGPVVRSLAFEVTGREDFEGGYLELQSNLEKEPEASAAVLRGDNGAVLAFASLTRDYRWPGSVWLLDHFARVEDTHLLRSLLEALHWPEGKVQAYLDRGHPSIPALESVGMRHEACFQRHFIYEDAPVDVEVYARHRLESGSS